MNPDTPTQDLYNKLTAMLSVSPLLHDLTPLQIAQLAGKATFEEHKRGEVLLKQSSEPTGFFFILEGQIRAIDEESSPPKLLNYRHQGEFIGEHALLTNDPTRNATVEVVVDVIIACFTVADWKWLLSLHHNIEDRIKKAEGDYLKRAELGFAGQQGDEIVIIQLKRHLLVLLVRMTGPLMLIMMFLLIHWLFNDTNFLTAGARTGILVAGLIISLIWMIYEYFEWENDDFIVSSERVIHIERTILSGGHREETPLTQVLNVEINTPNFVTRLLGYSNVITKTAGVGSLVFDGIMEGNRVKETIFEQRDKAKERVKAGDISSIRKALSEQVGINTPKTDLTPLQKVLTSEKPLINRLPRLLRYYLPISREETNDVIIWHKHYWIWLQQIWIPALAGLGVLYLLIASILVLPPYYKTDSRTVMALLVLLAIVLFWYTYQHDDWYKDVYKITRDKIIHQDSTAFRLRGEEIKETTFDNVQNINYKTPTFFSRIFNLGDVIIKTATVGEPFVFKSVHYPRDVQQDIFQRWLEFKEKQRRRQRQEEEQRFTTWLGEYHKMAVDKNSSSPQ